MELGHDLDLSVPGQGQVAALVNVVMILRVPLNALNFKIYLGTSASREGPNYLLVSCITNRMVRCMT